MLCTIVGAGPGLGAALTTAFAATHDVAFIARRPERLDDHTLRGDARTEVRGFAADVADPQRLQQAFQDIHTWHGPSDVLIYNAARMIADNAATVTPDEFAYAMRVNVGAAIQCTNIVLPSMLADQRGTILFTGGGLALEPYPTWTTLGAGKAALRSYSLALHKEVRDKNVHVAVLAICGIIEAGGPFDPAAVAEVYHSTYRQSQPDWSREVVYLPEGADPYYNDPEQRYRESSRPVSAQPVLHTMDAS